ncbi:MAG: lysophospholipid acyltransferase family protein [Pseudomonadota bacterium]
MIVFRSFLFRAVLFTTSPLFAILMWPALLFGEKGGRWFAKNWARMVFAELRIFCGIRHEVAGLEHMPTGGAIVAANHQSMWETFALYALLPKPAVVMKKELLRIPVFGWFQLAAGNIVIDREGGAKALRALTRATNAAVADGKQIIVFPEGTRMRPGETTPFQPGVAGIYAAAGTPCHPAVHNSGEHWQYPGGRKTPGMIRLRFLPPIPPGLDRRSFKRELETVINGARPDIIRAEEAV